MTQTALAFLDTRRSVPSRQLGEPAPDDTTLRRLLEAAIRVPDHGKLEPFRIRILRGEAKRAFGRKLAKRAVEANPDLSEAKREKEQRRYEHAPLVLVVSARIDEESKVPELEQDLAAGCVAYNILLGAQALGYGAQWLTGWAAYDRDVAKLLGMKKNEHVIGFIHVGTPAMEAPERDRPAYDDIVSTWEP
ncbi:nitroreductase [Luteibacter jiangsuensis]|uniref:Putative NAD(P)H nitroreductase n=1 Tax=Luteibacter jiangsuensis TaxID=637577 RepID=A0ABT9SYQ8_9GAMM|nr:nitroreductase [Luteibacter jiangsuensis]MDQ0010121.1 nitroreductase [Luteibacter jiangsuensis]